MSGERCVLSKTEKNVLMDKLVKELPVLRAKIGISQEELGLMIGVSRQTLSAIENRKRDLSWNMFVILALFFFFNKGTSEMILSSGIFSDNLKRYLNVNWRE